MNVVQPAASVRRTLLRRPAALTLALAALLVPALAPAQQPVAGASPAAAAPAPRPLSLDEAIRLAARESEVLQIARAGVTRAEGQLKQARSLYLPQLNGNVSYARTLRSQLRSQVWTGPRRS